MLWFILPVLLIALIYYYGIKPYDFWRGKGVKQAPVVPFIGTNWITLIKPQSFTEFIDYVYNLFPNERCTGLYLFWFPVLIVKDPDLLKSITVKEFENFPDHRTFISENSDPLWGKNLFALKGQKWREMRSTLSPAFTSSKMKQIFALISEAAEQFAQYFLKHEEKDVIEIQMKDTYTRFANDVIASTAFGIKCDSLSDRDNEFYIMGKEITNFGGFWKGVKITGYLLMPKLFQYFKIPLFSEKVSNFFFKIITENIASREKNLIVRQDMIHLLMEARKNGLKYEENESKNDAGFATVEESEIGKKTSSQKLELTDMDITAQALIFFFAGFDTVSTAMSFTSYELAVNPDIQKRLREEIDEVRLNGKLTYEAFSNMEYLDMVISESLRKWPPAMFLDRICTKSYQVKPATPDEAPFVLDPGTVVWVPVYSIHRDPRNYPDPEKFDPERFSEGNKGNIKPYTYFPFGSGPRNCIGSRFALLEVNTLFFHLLSNFEIVTVGKTQIPLKIDRKSPNIMGEDGIWLGFKRRQDI